MSDLIEREEAIKAIDELPNAYNGWSDAYDKAYIISTLEEVPKADRPQGEWIMHIDDLFPCESTQECSICHAEQLINGNDDNFCPNCGARMKGADDE